MAPTLRILYVFAGTLALLIGVVGVFVPLLPTVPFLLVAAACYSRGSERLRRWLVEHPRLGPPIVAWQSYGVIRPQAKLVATVLLTISTGYVVIGRPDIAWPARLVAALTTAGVLAFLLSRPSCAPAPASGLQDGERAGRSTPL